MRRLLRFPKILLLRFKYKVINFLLCNIKILHSKRLTRSDVPSCQQKTFITGPGRVFLGMGCSFGYKIGGFHRGGSIEIQARLKGARIRFGDKVSTNNNVFICAVNLIEIGSLTLIGQNVCIMDFEAHGIASDQRAQLGKIGKVIIGKNVWIGNNVTILKNSIIGDNTIVATGSVVSGKFDSNLIIGGIPAKIIKSIDG